MCIDSEASEPPWMSRFGEIDKILTITGITMSVLGYTFTILIYGGLKELRSVPSLLMVGLCVALLACDLCMISLMMTVDDKGYKVLALSTHFFLLLTLIWINMLAIEYFSVLVLAKSHGNAKQ